MLRYNFEKLSDNYHLWHSHPYAHRILNTGGCSKTESWLANCISDSGRVQALHVMKTKTSQTVHWYHRKMMLRIVANYLVPFHLLLSCNLFLLRYVHCLLRIQIQQHLWLYVTSFQWLFWKGMVNSVGFRLISHRFCLMQMTLWLGILFANAWYFAIRLVDGSAPFSIWKVEEDERKRICCHMEEPYDALLPIAWDEYQQL